MAALDEEKGVMRLDDLEQHRSTVTRPIHTTYRGHTIYEVPPPTQVSVHMQQDVIPTTALTQLASHRRFCSGQRIIGVHYHRCADLM